MKKNRDRWNGNLVATYVLMVSICLSLSTGATTALGQSSETATASLDKASGPKRLHVLMIAVDDLNHWVGHLGRNPQAKTPNIDRLAKMGVTFTNANCAAPVCNPSRAALMSGLRPSTSGVYDNGQDWRPVIGKELTLTTQFLKNGYNVFGAGKIYHANVHRAGEWTEYQPHPKDRTTAFGDPDNTGVGGIKFQPLTEDSVLADEQIVDYAIEKLAQSHTEPFFMAVGLHKPHMPWNVPKHYFDRFPLESIELPKVLQDDLADVPEGGRKMAKAEGDHASILKSGRWKEAVQAYLATISYCDDQVGRLLDAYDKSPYKNETMIVFWGDHGWHLGEKEHWRKFALWEESTRMPYIWVVPGSTQTNQTCHAPVDLMSLYPTLLQINGISKPEHVEGDSIVDLLKDVEAKKDSVALTTFHKNNHSIRTSRWRYISYADGGEELYDHENDPYEWKNLASDSQHSKAIAELRKHLPKRNAAEIKRSPGKNGQGKNLDD